MSWTKIAQTEQDLSAALNAFNWASSAEIVESLIADISSQPELFPERAAKSILGKLRRKRRLSLMARFAEALLQSGQNAAVIRRQYAQALIDLGYLTPAERLLAQLVDEAKGTVEEHEARALLGRISKQIYVNNKANHSPRNRAFLERALTEYLTVYRLRPASNLWSGVNAVALADLARRDGLELKDLPDATGTALEILEVLDNREANTPEGLSTWDLATAMEARLSLGETSEALRLAIEYTESPGADAFEINSTLRQLIEVWGLTDSEAPGAQLLPVLRAALVRRHGGSVTLHTSQAGAELKPEVRLGLEKVFGTARFQTLKWYQRGLEAAESVARIERLNGQGHGTGWLVRGEEFCPDEPGRLLVITNYHVVSDPPFPGALRPHEAKVHFQMHNLLLDVDRILWQSPPSEYDFALLSLKSQPDALNPLDLAERPPPMGDPAPRLYIIGHPGGRDLEFSLEDSQLVGANEKLLHYRTPTQGGSSGSPVFEGQEWKVVALHHAGKSNMSRLDGKEGTYEANEAISIHAIRAAITSGRKENGPG
jgi:hypothetical protein